MAKIPFSIEHREKIESGEYKVETKNGRPIRVLAWDLPCDFPIATAEFTEDNRVIVESYSVDGWVGYGEKENNLVIVTPEPELTPFEKKLIQFSDERNSMECDNISEDREEEILANHLHRKAAELLDLAREQLQPEIDAKIEEAYKNADEVMYKKWQEDLLQEIFEDSSTEELENRLKIFHDIFKNKDCSATAIRNWAQLFRTIVQKEYFTKTNLTASETIKELLSTEYEKGKTAALKDLPRWKKCPLYFEHGDIGKTNKDEDILSYQGYSILLSDLAKLPKEDSHE